MTRKVYLEQCERLELQATVVSILEEQGTESVVLDQTVFHPQGGGQKGDRGSIGDVQVTDTRHGEGGEVLHIVPSAATLREGQVVQLMVDPAWRRLNSRLHSGGHLIAALVEQSLPGLRATSGHHWPGEARVAFEGSVQHDVESLVDDLNEAIRAALMRDEPIRVLGDPQVSRQIQVGGFAPVGCGGTHVASLAALESLRITRVSKKGGALRVSYTLD